MYNGSNDYNAKRLTPSEVVVSRTLQSRYRNFSNVIWRSGKPALDSEWNLINDMSTEMLTSYIQSSVPSGWLDFGKNAYSVDSGKPNTFVYYAQNNQQALMIPNALVNGWPVLVAGVGHTDTILNSIVLRPAGPVARYDFVFLEVWRAQLRMRDSNNNPISQNKPDVDHIWKFGNTQFGVDVLERLSATKFKSRFAPLTTGTYLIFKNNALQIAGTHYTIVEANGEITFTSTVNNTDKVTLNLINVNLIDDMVDTAIKPSTNGIETSQRVQVQYRIRHVEDVIFGNTESVGFEDIKVQGQGGNPNPQVAGYVFTNMKSELGDCGLWRAGAGDEASKIALDSVDGFTYAIPMFKVYRRSTVAYNDTGANDGEAAINQQGNSRVLSQITSDRPDNKFNDGIDASDIVDLRNKVFPQGLNEHQVLETNIDKLFSGELKSNFIQSIFYNSISDSDVFGYTDFLNNQGASGKRIYWSDAPVQQNNIFAEVKTSTTDNSLDVFRVSGTGNWIVGDVIKVKVTSKTPVGTTIKATPRIYIEDKTRTDISSRGTWAGLNTSEATFTFTSVTGLSNYDIWVYYDMLLPAGQGISYVPDEVLRINYVNYSSFLNGTVVRGMRLEPEVTRFQDLFDHPFENRNDQEVFVESSVLSQRKQIKVSPLIQTTSSRNGATRTLEVETLDRTAKTIYVPFALQHLKGVYTAATGGTEVSMQQLSGLQVDGVDDANDQILLNEDYYIGKLTSLKYDPTGAFTGTEIEMLISGGGQYGPVYEHRVMTGQDVGTRVKLFTSAGEVFNIPSSALVSHFRWSGERIKVRQGTNYGYDLNNFIIDCKESDNNNLFDGMADRQQLWIDCDYLGAPHKGAELRIIYKHTPYQGSNIGSQELSLVHKRERGFFFNNGTGGGTIAITGTDGTSNYSYTPLSPKLPGPKQDYFRNGTVIEVASCGQKRFDSDISTAAYDLYGYLGGCTVWANDFTMPATSEVTQRGFLSAPMLEAIFEEPVVDAQYAEFVLPTLVKNKATGQLYLMIQIGNKGIHKEEEGPVLVDLFHLDERILLK